MPIPLRFVPALAALLLAAASPVAAQQPGAGRVAGLVHDSIAGKPLPGAVVTVRRVGSAEYLAVSTDAVGKFRLDDLAAGRYLVGFATAFLDSLELELPPVEVGVPAGGNATVALATPSRATLFTAACPTLPSVKGRGALVGQAADADTDAPLADADIVVSWREIGLDIKTIRPTSETRTAEVRTDARGMYRVCNVPTDTWIAVQVQQGGRAGAAVRAMVRDDAGVLARRLSLSRASALDMAHDDAGRGSATHTPGRRLGGTAVVTGHVRDAAGAPVADAQLQVVDGSSIARSDEEGRFTLGGLPAGTQILEARRVGFAPGEYAVELRSGATMRQDVRLTRAITLDSVLVTARRSRYQELETRTGPSRTASAIFTETELARFNLSKPSDLFRGRVLGFDLHYVADSIRVRSTRGRIVNGKDCYANIVIDGMQWQEIDLLPTDQIGAIEVYRGAATAPVQYDSPCGVVLIWTKR